MPWGSCVSPAWPCRSQGATNQQAQSTATEAQSALSERAILDRYCITCHNDRLETGGLSFDAVDITNVGAHAEVWERVVRKLRAGAMPPQPRPRPDRATYDHLVTYLETRLDRAAAADPDPGRTATFRRLTRTEYQNAIRDLLALEIDVTALLPRDDVAFGFDNVNTGGLSPTLMERYLAAARSVSELAVGSQVPAAGSRVVIVPADRTQEDHVDGLPFGTRGGTAVNHMFSFDGDYEIQVRLQRNRNENIEGLTEPHEVELTLDGERLQLFTMEPNRGNMVILANAAYYTDEGIDNHLNVRLSVTAGPHVVGASFIKKNSALLETTRQPYRAHFNMDRHPRQQPARTVRVDRRSIRSNRSGETPSRDRIFSCRPTTESAEDAVSGATSIIAALARRAYRRPVTVDDLDQLISFYREGQAEGGFDTGIETALRALLAVPSFSSGSSGIRPAWPPVRPTVSATSSWRRVCRSSSGAACRTTSCSRRPRRAGSAIQRCSRHRCVGCWRTRAPSADDELRVPVAAPAKPGCRATRRPHVSGFRRQPAPGVPHGNPAAVSEHRR